ncbi:N-acetylmuramoyl-L-alanine amidase [Acidovorax sp. NPDC077693]|uniref:peptidoglycan recognition protein family protein n=2 Tax=Acidovorax TaxID=12916 RepID=UPI0037CB3220
MKSVAHINRFIAGRIMLKLSADGMVIENSRVVAHRVTSIERSKMAAVMGIIAHQTGSSTENSTLASYKQPGANGAHFLISKTGVIYQTASIMYRTNHIGPIRARCLAEVKCTPSENSAYKKMGVTRMHAAEMKKSVPERYPSNSETIGIEIVGQAFLPANKPMPKGLSDVQQKRFFNDHSVYEALTGAQQMSFKYLLEELLQTLSLEKADVFRHPTVSRKNVTEAATAEW